MTNEEKEARKRTDAEQSEKTKLDREQVDLNRSNKSQDRDKVEHPEPVKEKQP